MTVKNALRASLEIDDCEFGTRMGFTKEEDPGCPSGGRCLVAQ